MGIFPDQTFNSHGIFPYKIIHSHGIFPYKPTMLGIPMAMETPHLAIGNTEIPLKHPLVNIAMEAGPLLRWSAFSKWWFSTMLDYHSQHMLVINNGNIIKKNTSAFFCWSRPVCPVAKGENQLPHWRAASATTKVVPGNQGDESGGSSRCRPEGICTWMLYVYVIV